MSGSATRTAWRLRSAFEVLDGVEEVLQLRAQLVVVVGGDVWPAGAVSRWRARGISSRR